MGGRGGAPNAGTSAPAAAPPASGDPTLSMVKDVFANSPRAGVRDMQMSSIHEMRLGLAARGMTDRAVQDRELIRLSRSGDVQLFPLANQKILSQAERDHIFLGGEKKNGIMLASKNR